MGIVGKQRRASVGQVAGDGPVVGADGVAGAKGEIGGGVEVGDQFEVSADRLDDAGVGNGDREVAVIGREDVGGFVGTDLMQEVDSL